MLSIETHFVGPTNTKGARYVATTANGHRAVVSKDYGLNDEQEHARAAMQLASTMLYGPQGGWVAGSTKRGYVFVPVGGNVYHEDRKPEPQCECADPGCPHCNGKCLLPIHQTLYRIDMDDASGTQFCEECANDAMESGVFAMGPTD